MRLSRICSVLLALFSFRTRNSQSIAGKLARSEEVIFDIDGECINVGSPPQTPPPYIPRN